MMKHGATSDYLRNECVNLVVMLEFLAGNLHQRRSGQFKGPCGSEVRFG
jgi:hypothetical protein